MEKHTSVLLREAVDALAIKPDGIYVDATLGAHGHGDVIVASLSERGTYIGIDADPEAIAKAQAELHGKPTIILRKGNFRDIDSIVEQVGIQEVDGVCADLGWRMEQFSGNGKGFSFLVDEPLIMTYGEPESYPFTAFDIVNEWDEENIVSILTGYGEERYARRIARGIVEARTSKPIRTTGELARVIESNVPLYYRKGKINPSTRTFHALRITVNDELGALEELLAKSLALLKKGGRLALITFHSLEDRVVKHTFRAYVADGRGTLVNKRPVTPTREEVVKNRRARSAKLRILEKT